MTRVQAPAFAVTAILAMALCFLALPAEAVADETGAASIRSATLTQGESSGKTASGTKAPDRKSGEAALKAGVKVYRLYNPATGEHLYTKNKKERNQLTKRWGWNSEGIGWVAPRKSSTPVYRLYNPATGEHHYTTSKEERHELTRNCGWIYERIGWYSADPGSVRVSVYREYDASRPSYGHNFTSNAHEHALLVKGGWHAEGIAWYGLGSTERIKKGWIDDGKGWRFYKHGKRLAGRWVVTRWAPGLPGAATDANSGKQRYWIDSKGRLAVKRLVNPQKKRDEAAGCYAYATKTGAVVRGIFDNGRGRVFVADKKGRLPEEAGWLETDEFEGRLERYYIESKKHAARSGLFEVDGQLYYGTPGRGFVVRNTRVNVNGSYYNADNEGVLTEDVVVNNLVAKAQRYSSPSDYLIMVDIDDPRTIVFEGSEGNWNVKFIWDCDTGAPESPTILGVYHVGIKGYSFGENHGYSCYYYTQFCGDYLFHTRKYHPYTHDLLDARMGERISEGCVRLYDEDAIWIQDNIPEGTTVVTTR